MKRRRKRHSTNSKYIIILAYANRYIFPFILLIIMFFGKVKSNYVPFSISLLVFSAYQLIGYLCRWKHIFCSFQNAYHQKMTPEQINWDSISKFDAYGCPCFFAVLGVLFLLI